MLKKVLEIIKVIAGAAIIGAVVYYGSFALGHWGNELFSVIGTERKNIEREQFEHSKSYVHGKTEDLQRYKRELESTEDAVERQALIILIQDEFASFDETLIENSNLRYFLNDIRNGNIK